ncbi:hypothetical protein [Eisenbergiella sp.]
MDKYEYKIRAEEIKTLISQKKYVEAAKVADTIDWTRVKSVMMLCTVSDLYKVNRRFDDAKLLLEMANERHPAGRMIIYSLCDLSIKMGEVVQAIEYYKDFVQIAPNDSGRYVLQYKLYEAQDVGLEERIAVLEELKKRDYREKWAYELAYLYHRVGLATKCVEECDELILWFGEGKYVIKAMELKMLHQPLSPAQQQKFEAYMMRKQGLRVPEPEEKQKGRNAAVKNGAAAEDDIHVKPMDVGQYNTINLQKELAKSMEELMLNGKPAGEPVSLQAYKEQLIAQEQAYADQTFADQSYDISSDTGEMNEQNFAGQQYGGEQYEQYEYEGGQPAAEQYPAEEAQGYQQETPAQEYQQQAPVQGYQQQSSSQGYQPEANQYSYLPEPPAQEYLPQGSVQEQPAPYTAEAQPVFSQVQQPEVPAEERYVSSEPKMNSYLSQEYDGQIGLVVPEEQQIERQITGQMNIEDIMKEWEKMKHENEEKRRKQLQQRVMEQTGSLFRDFDETARKGVLERLQKEERIPVERKRHAENSVISAHTKIWAAEEVENAIKRAGEPGSAAAQGVVPGGAPLAAVMQGAGNAAGMAAEAVPSAVSAAGSAAAAAAVPVTAVPASAVPATAVPAAVPVNAVPAAGAGMPSAAGAAPEPGMKELSPAPAPTQQQMSAEAAAPQPVTPVPEAQFVPEAPLSPVPQALPESQTVQTMSSPEVHRQPEAQSAVKPEGQAQPIRTDYYEQPVQPYSQPQQEIPAQAPVYQEPEASYEPEVQDESAPYVQQPYEEAAAQEEAVDEEEYPEEEVSQEEAERREDERLEQEIRSMSREEKQLFASFVPTKGAMKRLVRALDRLSLAAYTGNLIITGDPGSDTMNLTKNIVRDFKAKDHNFSAKLAKIDGEAFSKKNPAELIEKLAGGALVIDSAGDISDESMGSLLDALNQERTGILVILVDTKRNIKKLISANPEMESFFNARFDIEALDNGTLVAYGCQYAKMQEYAIDELGRLALHTRIEDMQTSDHIVTVNDVRDIVDEAIDHANRKTPKHFMDVLLAKRYDDDDMIILHEGDFI